MNNTTMAELLKMTGAKALSSKGMRSEESSESEDEVQIMGLDEALLEIHAKSQKEESVHPNSSDAGSILGSVESKMELERLLGGNKMT